MILDGYRSSLGSDPHGLNQVCQLRYRAVRQVEGQDNFVIWSFAIIDDLRSKA